MRDIAGFTLVEILVVISIVTVLLGIAIPTYRIALTRSQVAVAHANLNRIETALDWYASDHGSFPPTVSRFPFDPLAVLSNHQLQVLTTPIRYLSPGSLKDPFGVVEAQFIQPVLASNNDFPRLNQPNQERSLLYYHYPSLAVRLAFPSIAVDGACAISIGPDKRDSLGAYRPFDADLFLRNLSHLGYTSPQDTVYSPTNGTFSEGDIGSFVGEARHFQVP